jgi:hypothetical protein
MKTFQVFSRVAALWVWRRFFARQMIALNATATQTLRVGLLDPPGREPESKI